MKRTFGSLERRGHRLFVRWQQEGRRFRRAVGTDPVAADDTLREIASRVRRGAGATEILAEVFGERKAAGATFASLVDPYLAAVEGLKRPSTLEKDRKLLRAIAREEWATEPLASIDTALLARWRDRLRAAGRKVTTVNRYLSAVSAVLEWAREAGKVEANPARDVKRGSEARNKRERYLDVSEAERALKACDPEFRPYVLAALETGCRAGELRALRWHNVDLDRRRIVVRASYSKTGETRAVDLTRPMTKALRAMRRERPSFDGSDHVFTWGGAPITDRVHRREWEAVCRRANLPDVRFHDLRHTTASWLAAAGISLPIIGKILGHKHTATTNRYVHIAEDVTRAAIDHLDRQRREAKRRAAQ